MTNRYYATFIPADGSYSIVVPDLPKVASQGKDINECLEMASDAIKNVAEDYRAHGINMPEPSGMFSAEEKLKAEMEAMGEGYELPAGICLHPFDIQLNSSRTPFPASRN